MNRGNVEKMIRDIQNTPASYISKDCVMDLLRKIERRQTRSIKNGNSPIIHMNISKNNYNND